MDGAKIGAIVIVIIVVIIIIVAIIWCCSGSGSRGCPTVDPKHKNCLNKLQSCLYGTVGLTRVYIVESYGELRCGNTTAEALEKDYYCAYSHFFGKSCGDRARRVTDLEMSKYPLFSNVVADPSQAGLVKEELHKINISIAAELQGNTKPKNCKGGKPDPVVQLLDNIDLAIIDQIIYYSTNCAASMDAYRATSVATTAYYNWLVGSYCKKRDIRI